MNSVRNHLNVEGVPTSFNGLTKGICLAVPSVPYLQPHEAIKQPYDFYAVTDFEAETGQEWRHQKRPSLTEA